MNAPARLHGRVVVSSRCDMIPKSHVLIDAYYARVQQEHTFKYTNQKMTVFCSKKSFARHSGSSLRTRDIAARDHELMQWRIQRGFRGVGSLKTPSPPPPRF